MRLAGELHAAIRKVATEPGHVVLSVTARLLKVPEVDNRVRLSHREVQILSEAADAFCNRQIAHRLGVTEGTVKRHLHNISNKLAASSRIDAVNKARAAGLLRVSHDDVGTTCPRGK